MKLIIVIMTTFLMQVSASGFAQRITLRDNSITLKEAFSEIKKQTGYLVLYEYDLIINAKPVKIDLKDVPLERAMDALLKNHDLSFSIADKQVVIKKKTPSFLDRLVDAFTPPVNVSGVVLDEKGMPLAGATVSVKGFKLSVITDKEGKFYLPGVDDKAVLVVSYVGYSDQQVAVKASLTVSLALKSAELEEVVVAYGRTTQQALTGAVTVIKGEQIANQPNMSFDKSLQGLVPGLMVTGGSMQPGAGVSSFILRGISSGSDGFFGSTARNPLIILDGVPVDQRVLEYTPIPGATPVTNRLAQLNPNDIESISVLKDAAAIALYGSKASNGVLLVTTKRGKAGNTGISFNQNLDFRFRPKQSIEMLNPEEYMELLYESYRNFDPVTYDTDAKIKAELLNVFPYRLNGTQTTFYEGPDWYDVLYRGASPSYTGNISVSGGAEKSSFYVNAEYGKQNGIVKGTDYERSSLRLNYDLKPNSFIKVSNSTILSYNKQGLLNPAEGLVTDVTSYISPLFPVKDDNGKYIFNYGGNLALLQNPAAELEFNREQQTAYSAVSTFKADVNFLKYFTFSSTLGVNFMLSETYRKKDPRFFDGFYYGEISEYSPKSQTLINSNYLNFNKEIGPMHRITLQIGQEAQVQSDRQLYLMTRSSATADPYYEDIFSPDYTLTANYLRKARQTLLSQFGQVQYSVKDRYFLSGSLRRDGSSLFGSKNQWANYWSVGAGWVVSEESFMQSIQDYVSYLKFRGSLGIAGNSANVLPHTRYAMIDKTIINGEPALIPDARGANSKIKWEQTYTWDGGMDMRLFKDKMSLTLDLYKKFTKNLIYQTNLAPHTGYSFSYENIGDLSNTGLEVSLNANLIKKRDFTWQVNGNWSMNRNKLTKAYIPVERTSFGDLGNEVGRNYNSFYIPVWMGISPDTGAPQWMDAEGKPTSVYSMAKREFVGKPQPDGFGSISNTLNWKGIGLDFQLYYKYGFQVLNYTGYNLSNSGSAPYNNQSKAALDRWQKPGDIASNPKRVLNNQDQSGRASTRYLQDGDYIGLQRAGLSYQFPNRIAERLKLGQLRLFLQGTNLAQFSLVKNVNPDNMGLDGSIQHTYPQTRTYTLGLNINF